MNRTEKDPLQKKLELTNWIILGIILAPSFIFLSQQFTLGVLLGGLISIVNFHWLGRDLRKVFSSLSDSSKSSMMFKYYIRFGITAVILYFIITGGLVDIIGLLAGLSLVVVNVVFTVVTTFSKKNCLEEVR
ncbi:MAG: ATP synthase subunit I [Deltaproteobacteria bacterium]|nr:ATP synthase subunit I [Deltaproteobacteria bacterium]